MTPEEIKEIILIRLNESEINSWHGITKEKVDQLLIEPTTIELTSFGGQKKSYWLILDELSGDWEKGYQIVYDKREGIFGLATKITIENNEIGYLVGLYGSFEDALNNM